MEEEVIDPVNGTTAQDTSTAQENQVERGFATTSEVLGGNLVEIPQAIPTFNSLSPEMQQYVVDNFSTFTEEEIALFSEGLPGEGEASFRESLAVSQAERNISDIFSGPPNRDSVNEQRQIIQQDVQSRLLELFPELEGQDLTDSVDTVTEIIDRESLRGNPMSSLYGREGAIGATTFSELQSFVAVGDASESLTYNRSELTADDLTSSSLPTQQTEDVGAIRSVVNFGVGNLRALGSGLFSNFGELLESPASLADISDAIAQATQPVLDEFRRDTQTMFEESGEDPAEAPEAMRRRLTENVRNVFRGNPVSTYLKNIVDAPTDMDGDILGRLREGDLTGAGKQTSYMLFRMGGEILGSLGAGRAIKATGVAAPRLPTLLGLTGYEKQKQFLTEEGLDPVEATLNATAYGVTNAVLSEIIVVDKLKALTGAAIGEFGAATGREFAVKTIGNMAKTAAFDGTLMASSEGLLSLVDYSTGVIDEVTLDGFINRTGNGLIIGLAGSTLLSTPSVYMAYRNRNIRAAQQVDTTSTIVESYRAMQDAETPEMRSEIAAQVKDSAELPTQIYLAVEDIPSTLGISLEEATSRSGLNSEIVRLAQESGQPIGIPLDIVVDAMTQNLDGNLDFAQVRTEIDGPTSAEAAVYNEALDKFYTGVMNGEVKVGTLADELLSRVGVREFPRTSSSSLVSSARAYVRALYDGSFGNWKNVFGKRDMEPAGPAQAPELGVTFRRAETPDAPIPGATLKTLPPSLDGVPPLDRAFAQKVIEQIRDSDKARTQLDAEYQALMDQYRLTDENARQSNAEFYGDDNANFDTAKIQKVIFENLASDPSLRDASELVLGQRVSEQTGRPLQIDYNSFVEVVGKEAAARLSRGLQNKLFTRSNKPESQGLLFQDALVELGVTPEVFLDILTDKDVRGVIKNNGVEGYAAAESEKLAKIVVRNMERYNKMVSTDRDPLVSAYERWLKDESANEAIDKHLNPDFENLRAKEVQDLEKQLPREFRRQASPLIKGGRLTKEAKAQILNEVLDYDYKYIQKSAFLMDALNLEKYHDTQSAKMLRVGNIKKAYESKIQALRMREYVKAQYQAIRLFKQTSKTVNRIKDADNSQLVNQGYDIDYVQATRYAMAESGLISRTKGVTNYIESLSQQDPVKYQLLAAEFNPYVPDIRSGMSLRDYTKLTNILNQKLEAKKGESVNYTLNGKRLDRAVEDIFDSLMRRELEVIDRDVNPTFSANFKGQYAKLYKLQLENGVKIENIDRKGLMLEARNLAKKELNINIDPNSVGASVSYVARTFDVLNNFVLSLDIPELNAVIDSMRQSETNLINGLNAEGGHVPFLRNLTAYVNQHSDKLSFKGTKRIGNTAYTANQINAIVMNLGNEGNFARLARREFGVTPEALKQIVKDAIDQGVITKEHFAFAQLIGEQFERKFNELQGHYFKTFGERIRPINKDFPLADTVPSDWVKGGWYVPVKTQYSPISETSLAFKKTEAAVERALSQFSDEGFMQDLGNLFSDEPIEAGFERSRSRIEGAPLSLEVGDYLNQFVQIEKVIHTRDTAVAANKVFLDLNIAKALDAVAPGVMENTIYPALRAFNDQTIQSGALGDIRMETANKSISKWTTAVTGITAKAQIAYNVISPFLNIAEITKAADLLAQSDSTRSNRLVNTMTIAGRMLALAIDKNKVTFYQDLMPYLKGRQQNEMTQAMRTLDATLRQTQGFRSGLSRSRKASQLNAFIDNNSRFLDHYTTGLADAAAGSLFLDSYLAQGKSLAEAINLAERDVQRVMPGYFASELYAATRSNAGRIFFQYMGWAVKSLAYTSDRARDIDYRLAKSSIEKYGAYAGLAFYTLLLPAAMEDTMRGLLSGRNDLDEMADDFMSDPLLATVRLAGQTISAPADRIPLVGPSIRRAGLQLTSTVLGDEETRPGYLYNVYNAGKLFSTEDLLNVPVAAIADTAIDVGTGLYKYGTEGEYQTAYELFNTTQYRSVDPGTAASQILTLMGMSGVPVPAGPGPRNAVKFIWNLSTDNDRLSESGFMLDLLRGRGENLNNSQSKRSSNKVWW